MEDNKRFFDKFDEAIQKKKEEIDGLKKLIDSITRTMIQKEKKRKLVRVKTQQVKKRNK